MFLKNPNTALLGIIGISLMGLSLLGWMQTPDPALAKGPPDKVTIRAPGMSEEVEITDPQLLQAFAFFGFEDIAHPMDPPSIREKAWSSPATSGKESGGSHGID